MSSCWRLMLCWHCMRHLRNGVIVEGRYSPLADLDDRQLRDIGLTRDGINIVNSPDLMKIDKVFAPARVKTWTVSTQL